MNVLPHINFLSRIILLSPPVDYWIRIKKLVHQYIWNNGHPKLKLSVLQRSKDQGGHLVQRWLLPHDLSTRKWLAYFHDFVLLELSTARINKVQSSTLQMWWYAAVQIKNELLRLWAGDHCLQHSWLIMFEQSVGDLGLGCWGGYWEGCCHVVMMREGVRVFVNIPKCFHLYVMLYILQIKNCSQQKKNKQKKKHSVCTYRSLWPWQGPAGRWWERAFCLLAVQWRPFHPAGPAWCLPG